MNGYKEYDDADRLSIPTLVQYLKAFHTYYLDFQLPFIRKKLVDSLDENDNLARLILKLYDEYAHDIRNHMKYEEKTVFPYVDSLLSGQTNNNYDIETFSKHHQQTDVKLHELKNIIIKYLPQIHIVIVSLQQRYMIYIVAKNGLINMLMLKKKYSFLLFVI